ncbi:N5,N10-methylene tetrahydromethanopterin reductase [Thalassobaculum fulvum]|uniref:Luciferase-like monooxygenase n=1 Tax=Thalassobaculum fulvum TaxID=1633335 RepID=A0A918XN23_9PROT|nr:LLM class flavin-dependent oxidoreductase [Thalassobaculum fulvum]GHD40748.1 N5,N10-methylene tetrahydromethanopterin reductase [Thalassobaculum fulvum]
MKISILDQSVAAAGRPQGQAIRDTLALAQMCDRLGYHRFWVSEHHSHPTIVGSAPEILIAAIATHTTGIRVGSAGVMLPHYAPLKVAEQFRVLDALAPGRIDLGLGRAPGSDGRTAFALNPLANERPAQFPNDVADLMAWVHGEPLAEGHPFRVVEAMPKGDTAPEIWMLGSSSYGAQVGAHFGLPYSFAWFFTDGRGGPEALDLYRTHYKPSARHPKPNAGICVWALAAETEEEAQYHFSSRAHWQLYRDRGVYLPLDPPEHALGQEYGPAETARIEELRRTALVGTAPDVAARIRELADRLAIDEVAIVTWAHDERARHTSYTLLAREFGLAPRQAA